MLVPKLVTTFRTFDRRQFTADLSAGAIVGIVALPLAIAFAIASGVTPERGLYAAIVAGFLIFVPRRDAAVTEMTRVLVRGGAGTPDDVTA